jgi:glycosyltransferase involved in cell wall biosynthesis
MKVLHVIPSLNPALGGPTKVVFNIVKTLRRQGIDAEIATTNDNGAESLDVPLNERIQYQDVPVWFLPRFEPQMKEFLFSAALTKWLWQNISNYDIVDNHYLFSYASTCAGAIARWQKVPYTVRTQGQLTPWALAQSRLKKQIYTSLIERHNLNSAAAIHCTALGEAEDVRNFGIQTPIITLPLGVNKPEILPEAKTEICNKYDIPPDKPIVLFLSRLHYKKRPDLLIESLAELAKLGQDFHLIMAGSGEDEYVNYLKNLVKDHHGLAECTSWVGFVTGRDKDLFLQGSDIFVLPSFSENFGIVVAEAAIASLPIIITPGVQISPDIADANAGLVVAGKKAELVQALSQLISSPELRSQMGANAQKLASQKYSWSAISTQLIQHYLEITSFKTLNQDQNSAAKLLSDL